MFGTRFISILVVALIVSFGMAMASAQQDKKDEKKTKEGDKKKEKKKPEPVWTDINDPTLPADFKFQGEFFAKSPNGRGIGCQVIALGGGTFQAVLCKGGLPGMGWEGNDKSLMDGKIDGTKVEFVTASGKRKYLAQSPLEFSATAKFPPPGQRDFTATCFGETITIKGTEAGKEFSIELPRLIRKSHTLGAKPPDGAIVLFDGSNKDEWNGGRVDEKARLLNTDGKDITTKRIFNNYTAHVEFMLPFRPDARSQGRGNSGFYQVDQYEVQILDSFGLEGKDNECGGVYSMIAPKVNMCLPPLQWQTYDVDFTNAVSEGDKVIMKARLTVRHNGVVIHDDVELKGISGGSRGLSKKAEDAEGTPGRLRLQGHGNPLQFKNIWLVEKK